MNWNRLGTTFNFNNLRCQLPVLSKVNNNYHLWFSSKNKEGKSEGYMISFNNLKEITNLNLKKPNKILKSGKIGSYDTYGVMPMQEIRNYLFFIGWTVRKDVPYFNFTSIAERTSKNKYKKLGPILGPDIIDKGFTGTFFVLRNGIDFLGYYLSQNGWRKDEHTIINPTYDIKIAKSKNLYEWKKISKSAITLKKNEAGISSATIIKYKNIWHMWFSVRKAKNFRNDPKDSYRIKHAYSKNGLDWFRTNYFGLVPSNSYKGEDQMVCYPNVFKFQKKIYMLYNGNGFGLSGIKVANMDIEYLNKVN